MTNIRILIFCFSLVFTNITYADSHPEYLWNKDIEKLPKLQHDFVVDIIKSYRTDDQSLWSSLIHPDGLSKPECEDLWAGNFKKTTIFSKYGVKFDKGKEKDYLELTIVHREEKEKPKRGLVRLVRIVNYEGKLVIYSNCDTILQNRKNNDRTTESVRPAF
tara:strand:- start:72 stop:554 length:483 start_codon:yes stop_codon:yes gene_type:complete